MPPAAIGIPLAISGIAGAVGGGLSQAAANKGPRPLFPGLQQQGVSGVGKLGGQAFTSLGNTITNPGALPDVNASVDPAFQALVNANKQLTSEGAASVREASGVSGTSSGTAGAFALSDYYTQSNAQFMNVLAQYTLQAQEAAANRQLSASEAGLQAFLGPAFTDVGPKGSVAGAVLGGASQTASQLSQIALLQSLFT